MTPIGVFDSGYGGLTILQAIRRRLPRYDYIYIGDNARAPYGPRSFDIVYEFTRQAVVKLFEKGCQLVVIGCNTASAKALRTIQQKDLPAIDPSRRVLGVIRPMAEAVGSLTKTRHVGVLATEGTIRSDSYTIEIGKLYPDITVTGKACPLWAAIVEAGESATVGADFFVEKDVSDLLRRDALIDTIILGCTHYPILYSSIRRHTPATVTVVAQSSYVAESLANYLCRHADMARRCSTGGTLRLFTTESVDNFTAHARVFLPQTPTVEHIEL